MNRDDNRFAALACRDQLRVLLRDPGRAAGWGWILHDDTQGATIPAIVNFMRNSVETGETNYVADDVTNWMACAAAQLSADHELHFDPEDLPCHQGLIYFDTEVPLTRGSLHADRTDRLRAVVFGPTLTSREGSVTEDFALITLVTRENDRTLHPRHWWPVSFGEKFKVADQPIESYRDEVAAQFPEYQFPPLDAEEREEREAALAVIALFYTWTQFVRDQIVEVQRADLPRAERRRAQRERRPPPLLNVVLLRRVHHVADDPGQQQHDVNWSHRWIVSGHWRNQAYGPGHSLRRARYIHPFVKGPEDRPLVVKDHLVAVLR
jgi:hypothetical protein